MENPFSPSGTSFSSSHKKTGQMLTVFVFSFLSGRWLTWVVRCFQWFLFQFMTLTVLRNAFTLSIMVRKLIPRAMKFWSLILSRRTFQEKGRIEAAKQCQYFVLFSFQSSLTQDFSFLLKTLVVCFSICSYTCLFLWWIIFSWFACIFNCKCPFWVLSLFYFSAKLSTIVCYEDKVSLLLEKAHLCKELKSVIKIGSQVTQEQDTKARQLGLKLISMADLEVPYWSARI